ncbi:TIR domain-containing protein [Kitasatospora sp. RG8]|uniref:TIR-like protein FxsC n=1 Tax=Kitasatospora sp. RG8 TaxID=2820815 RepID=UPI001AE00F73|nr:TIR-like protein FxsC [Kitasatospora sp. RG8]MBP0451306.1 TIR domain-containing protein [Kitasatospora sp. RG8]
MRPYFFFSYARRDHMAGGAFVDQFFSDLRDELARIEPAAGPGELAYRDTERLRVGDDWEQQLSRMLAVSRTMVALYSPAYFASSYCGKEWTAFDGRMRRHQKMTGEAVPALIPVVWEPPPAGLPAEVLRIQYSQHDLGVAYATGGLRDLLRADPHGPDYRRVVRAIAERVREAACLPLTELPHLDLGRVDGCFPVPDAVPPPGRSGMVRIFVAAGHKAAGHTAARRTADPSHAGRRTADAAVYAVPGIPAQRQDEDRYRGGWYGDRPRDWAPYHPPRLPPLVVQAQQAITQAGHSTTLEEVGPGLAASLDLARENNEVSVLLVDPWAAGAEPYRQALRDFDDQNHPVTGVLVPAGTDDPPEGPARSRLWGGVRDVFPRNWLHRSGPEPLFKVRVPRERFETDLLRTVTVAQNRLLDETDEVDPVLARAAFGLGPGVAAMPALLIPAWPPAVSPEAALPPAPREPREGDSER